MPTPLPSRHRFWRRHKLSPEATRNLASTITEFGLALLCVSVTVLAIRQFGTIVVAQPPIKPPIQSTFGP